mmetsp:Transcript_18253/g.31242  ORF Transcript_18253/g.31242 Transcript_18253/m.31242 type:complete len:206 (-) Transcript_18253:174-791(-)
MSSAGMPLSVATRSSARVNSSKVILEWPWALTLAKMRSARAALKVLFPPVASISLHSRQSLRKREESISTRAAGAAGGAPPADAACWPKVAKQVNMECRSVGSALPWLPVVTRLTLFVTPPVNMAGLRVPCPMLERMNASGGGLDWGGLRDEASAELLAAGDGFAGAAFLTPRTSASLRRSTRAERSLREGPSAARGPPLAYTPV